MNSTKTDKLWMYVGTYTRSEPHVVGKSDGIYWFQFDLDSGTMSYAGVLSGVDNPSFLVLDPQEHYLFAANEVSDYGGQTSGAVSSYSIDRDSGKLTFINHQPTRGAAPCHLSVDSTGQLVVAANYGGGSFTVLPIQPGGMLGTASDFVQHEGSSVNPQRQAGPHAHSATIAPDNRFVFVADLGLDKVMIYRLDAESGKVTPNHDQPWARLKSGAGPRHFAFHPDGQYAYLVNELDSTLVAFEYDGDKGTLCAVQTVSTLPSDFKGRNYPADIHVHPSGKYVYSSNRGHDSIAMFEIDEKDGTVSPRGYISTQGKVPRNFAIDPTGAYLLAANQNSDGIVAFRIEEKTGELLDIGSTAEVPTPVCIKLMFR